MVTETRTIEIIGADGTLGQQAVLPTPEFDNFPPTIKTRNRLQEKLITAFVVLDRLTGGEVIEPEFVSEYIDQAYLIGNKPQMEDPEIGAVLKGTYGCAITFFNNPITRGTDVYIQPEISENGQRIDEEVPVKIALSRDDAKLFLGGKNKWQEVSDEEFESELLNLLSQGEQHIVAIDDAEVWREAVLEAIEKKEEIDEH